MAKAKVNINQEFCKGCGLCVNICPKKILVIGNDFNSKRLLSGYYDGRRAMHMVWLLVPRSVRM